MDFTPEEEAALCWKAANQLNEAKRIHGFDSGETGYMRAMTSSLPFHYAAVRNNASEGRGANVAEITAEYTAMLEKNAHHNKRELAPKQEAAVRWLAQKRADEAPARPNGGFKYYDDAVRKSPTWQYHAIRYSAENGMGPKLGEIVDQHTAALTERFGVGSREGRGVA